MVEFSRIWLSVRVYLLSVLTRRSYYNWASPVTDIYSLGILTTIIYLGILLLDIFLVILLILITLVYLLDTIYLYI